MRKKVKKQLKIHRMPISDLHPADYNPRTITDEALGGLRKSIERFGLVEPVVWNQRTGTVVGGHQRLRALEALGEREADVIVVDLPPGEEKALNVALNSPAISGEFTDQLAALLSEIQSQTPDIYADLLLSQLLDGAQGTEDAPSDIHDPGPGEPPENPTTQPGDLWLLGEHRLLCGDSSSAPDMDRLLAGERAALLSTDPPYCVNYTGADRPVHKGRRTGKDWSHVYREVDIADLGEFLDSVLQATLPQVDESAAIYLWHAHVQQPTIAEVFERHNLLLHQVIVWVKPTGVFGHSYYRWRHEPCAFGWRRGHKPAHTRDQLDTVWEADWEGKQRVVGNEHPTQKPLRLFEIPMEQHTRRGDLVLEPFSGSGSQLIAAERLGRRCRAMEISPAFCDVAVKRWEVATGKKATREAGRRRGKPRCEKKENVKRRAKR
ncbi:MAG: DNA modification methylase [Armatimonadetes bacterium]|nr:DNA modification methylase [Armatimonadota bacterium]